MGMHVLLHAQSLISPSTALQHLPLNLELEILARLLTIKFLGRRAVVAHACNAALGRQRQAGF